MAKLFGSTLAHNVKITYIFVFFYWAARSILFQQVLSGYIFVLTSSNRPVGLIKGIQGISQLVFSFPAALVADFTRRDKILRISGICGLLSALLTLVAIRTNQLYLMYACFALWGLFAAFQSPAMEALFADSIPHGQRSFPFMIKYNISNLAMVLGPLLSVLLFLVVGDVWHLFELQFVLAVGALLAALASCFLFQYNDDLAYENLKHQQAASQAYQTVEAEIVERPPHHHPTMERSRSTRTDSQVLLTPTVHGPDMDLECNYESESESDEMENPQQQASTTDLEAHPPKPSATATQTQKLEPVVDLVPTTKPLTSESSALLSRNDRSDSMNIRFVRFGCFTTDHVPWLLFVSDFIISNGAGMTINFFPLFFMQEYKLTPVQVNLLFLAQPIVIMVLSFYSQRLSKCLGRMPIICITRIFSTVCLLLMAFAQPLTLQVFLFLCRGGMMRCSQPLRRALLMDHVPRKYRARWNALEGLAVFSWSGSAVIGGYLIDAYNYRTCFFITSFVYFCGLGLELFLLPLTRHAVEK